VSSARKWSEKASAAAIASAATLLNFVLVCAKTVGVTEPLQ
jgi:hypothetical protein